jgi:hypothetical protein
LYAKSKNSFKLNIKKNMPAEKKRPRGLKSSAANKKAKVTKEPVQGEEPEVPENAQTIVIDKVVEEGDEIGEAAALYESGIEKLGNFFKETWIMHVFMRFIRN